MTDEELIAYLRRAAVSYSHPLWKAADRIEALVKEKQRLGRELNMARYGQPDFTWAMHKETMAELQARAEAAEAKVANLHAVCSKYEAKIGDEWRGRLASEAKVAKLVEALREIESIAVHSGGDVHGVHPDQWRAAFYQACCEARAALAEVEGGSNE